jgi:hypothetical protein
MRWEGHRFLPEMTDFATARCFAGHVIKSENFGNIIDNAAAVAPHYH